MTPRETFQRVVDGVTGQKWDELPYLYAEDTVVTHPMAPGAVPITGREAIRRHFAAAATMDLEMRAVDVVVHETTDPEVVIAEFAYEGRAADREFRIANLFVLRVRDGLIVESRDYADHLRFAAANGSLPALLATPSTSSTTSDAVLDTRSRTAGSGR